MTENGTPMYMPVAPAYGNMNGGNGGFFGGDNGWWIILLFLLAGNGNWGFGGGMNGGMFPWMMGGMTNTNNDVQRGFDQSAVINGITGVQNAVTNGFGNVQTALCNGFAGVANGFAQAEIANNARQMTDMQQNFALQQQFSDCCCENRTTAMQNTRDILESGNRNTQAILDKLCQLELDGVKQNYENRIAGMQNVIDGLNAQVNASDRRVAMGEEIDALYNRLNNCPVPSMPVYGRTPIFTCNGNNQGCGCGV